MIYYYYFQLINQVYIGLEVLGISALFCHLVSCGISIVLTIISIFLLINIFCFQRYRKFAIISYRTMGFFTSKYIIVILFCYGIEILLLFPICIIQTQYAGEFFCYHYLSFYCTDTSAYCSTSTISYYYNLLKISMIFRSVRKRFCYYWNNYIFYRNNRLQDIVHKADNVV